MFLGSSLGYGGDTRQTEWGTRAGCVARGGAKMTAGCRSAPADSREKEFFIDNLLVRIHFIIEMVWRTGLAPWEFERPFPGSLISTFLGAPVNDVQPREESGIQARGRQRVVDQHLAQGLLSIIHYA